MTDNSCLNPVKVCLDFADNIYYDKYDYLIFFIITNDISVCLPNQPYTVL